MVTESSSPVLGMYLHGDTNRASIHPFTNIRLLMCVIYGEVNKCDYWGKGYMGINGNGKNIIKIIYFLKKKYFVKYMDNLLQK